jgi:DNA (cytosine-5)-methyltransferase 1
MGIIVDLFAGGGGASQGIYEALGRHPDAAVNHDPQAVAIHKANHPTTEHWCQDVWSVDPSWVSRGRPVDLLWASPDCTHHSKAKGGPPNRNEKRRDLAMVITYKWVPALRPNTFVLENVEEFADWGPCDHQGVPIAAARGQNFRAFVNALRRHGYSVQWRELSACDYGAPTTRKRLFMLARNARSPIVWPEPTHGAPNSAGVLAGNLKPWRTAAEIIDWSLPCPSIFASSQEIWEQYGLRAVRPLAETTMRRIFKGIQRFVVDAPEPFIVHVNHTKKDGTYDCFRGGSLHEPLSTITQTHGTGLVMPFLQHVQHSQAQNGTMPVSDPVRTITSYPKGGGMALVAPFLSCYYGPKSENDLRLKSLRECLPVQTTENRFALVMPHIMKMYGTSTGQSCVAPLHTITGAGKFALIYSFFIKYYGCGEGSPISGPLPTITARDRFGLVTVNIDGETYAVVDIGMRMLAPHELLLAQGFPPEYTLEASVDGKKTTKSAQVAMIGNSVCPPLARALVAANYSDCAPRRRVPSLFERSWAGLVA